MAGKLGNAAMGFALEALRRGVHEIGINSGAAVRSLLAACGVYEAAPWCAAFVVGCIDIGAMSLHEDSPLGASVGLASVQNLYDLCAAKGMLIPLEQAAFGDIVMFCFDAAHPEHHDHTGFFYQPVTVAADLTVSVTSLDGNTNAAGGREGVKVALKTRPHLSQAAVHAARLP